MALTVRRQEAILAVVAREPVPPHLDERFRANLHILERVHRPRIRCLIPVRLSLALPFQTRSNATRCFVSYPIVFSELRGWSPGLTGLSYLGIGIGGVITILSEPLLRRMINAHAKDPATGKPYPEAMVSVVCIAAVCIPVGEMIFAWTCTPDVHWIAPLIAGIPFGAGNCGVFIYASNYLVHSYGIYAASALAGNAVLRSAMGGALPLAGPKMYVFFLSFLSPVFSVLCHLYIHRLTHRQVCDSGPTLVRDYALLDRVRTHTYPAGVLPLRPQDPGEICVDQDDAGGPRETRRQEAESSRA
jgi:hypothetical protein